MVTFYFDTSAIVKRYRKEQGSELLDKMFNLKEKRFATSLWTVLEFISAFSRLAKGGLISNNAFKKVVSRFLKDVRDIFMVISVNDELVALATSLATKHSLASADSLHLAALLTLRDMLGPGEKVVFVCSDAKLLKAAMAEGVECINPEEENSIQKLEETLSKEG